jgi:thioredoxin-related protein
MKRLVTIFFLFFLATPVWAVGLHSATDLQQDAREARATGRPILVLFMADSCSYCEEVRRLYVQPMSTDPAYRNRLIFRKVNIDDATPMKDFRGRRTSQSGFADAAGVSFTPTVRFYDARGGQLVPQLRGYSSPDFYLAYLQDAADASIKLWRTKDTITGQGARASF